jgi:hypothetical protein
VRRWLNRRFVARVFGAALLVGTLDIVAACLQYYLKTGKGPTPIFKYIASGVFGPDALAGGANMIVFGLLFHYSIAVSFTIFFFLISVLFPIVKRTRVTTGILYGIVVWLIMNLLVVPISNTPKSEFDWVNAGAGMLILIVCIGLPLSFIASSRKK